MREDPIRAALEVAGEAARAWAQKPGSCIAPMSCTAPPCWCADQAAAAAIAAFLEHMEVIQHMKTDEGWIDIAAAVRRAAKEEGDA